MRIFYSKITCFFFFRNTVFTVDNIIALVHCLDECGLTVKDLKELVYSVDSYSTGGA